MERGCCPYVWDAGEEHFRIAWDLLWDVYEGIRGGKGMDLGHLGVNKHGKIERQRDKKRSVTTTTTGGWLVHLSGHILHVSSIICPILFNSFPPFPRWSTFYSSRMCLYGDPSASNWSQPMGGKAHVFAVQQPQSECRCASASKEQTGLANE